MREGETKEVSSVKYINGFTLYDSGGNEVGHKKELSHLKVVYDEITNKRFPYKVKDNTSGYTLDVTDETKVDDWHSFSYKCDLALD